MNREEMYVLIRAHQYLYYVLGEPVISDHDFDRLEGRFEDKYGGSPIGSDLASSYTKGEISLARKLKGEG